MGWNEPDGKDPWGSNDKPGGGKRPNGGREEPPELDEVVQNIKKKLSGMFGGGGGGNNGGNQNRGNSEGPSLKLVFGIIFLIVLVYSAINSIHIVKQGERGVVTRFGAYQTTLQEGLAIRFPYPIEEVFIINKETLRTTMYGEKGRNYMLTADLNLIDVMLTVQYRISNPEEYKFQVADVDRLLTAATSSAIREVVGRYSLDYTLSQKRAAAGPETRAIIQSTMDDYKSGLDIVGVTIEFVQVPHEVKDAFDAATAARENRTRRRNEATAQSKAILPKADERRAAILNQAKAEKISQEQKAAGEVAGYLALLQEYEYSPEVTRERLYLEMVEEVYSNSPKVMLDVEQGNGMFYLPLQELMKQQNNRAMRSVSEAEQDVSVPDESTATPANTYPHSQGSTYDRSRSRDGRSR